MKNELKQEGGSREIQGELDSFTIEQLQDQLRQIESEMASLAARRDLVKQQLAEKTELDRKSQEREPIKTDITDITDIVKSTGIEDELLIYAQDQWGIDDEVIVKEGIVKAQYIDEGTGARRIEFEFLSEGNKYPTDYRLSLDEDFNFEDSRIDPKLSEKFAEALKERIK